MKIQIVFQISFIIFLSSLYCSWLRGEIVSRYRMELLTSIRADYNFFPNYYYQNQVFGLNYSGVNISRVNPIRFFNTTSFNYNIRFNGGVRMDGFISFNLGAADNYFNSEINSVQPEDDIGGNASILDFLDNTPFRGDDFNFNIPQISLRDIRILDELSGGFFITGIPVQRYVDSPGGRGMKLRKRFGPVDFNFIWTFSGNLRNAQNVFPQRIDQDSIALSQASQGLLDSAIMGTMRYSFGSSRLALRGNFGLGVRYDFGSPFLGTRFRTRLYIRAIAISPLGQDVPAELRFLGLSLNEELVAYLNSDFPTPEGFEIENPEFVFLTPQAGWTHRVDARGDQEDSGIVLSIDLNKSDRDINLSYILFRGSPQTSIQISTDRENWITISTTFADNDLNVIQISRGVFSQRVGEISFYTHADLQKRFGRNTVLTYNLETGFRLDIYKNEIFSGRPELQSLSDIPNEAQYFVDTALGIASRQIRFTLGAYYISPFGGSGAVSVAGQTDTPYSRSQQYLFYDRNNNDRLSDTYDRSLDRPTRKISGILGGQGQFNLEWRFANGLPIWLDSIELIAANIYFAREILLNQRFDDNTSVNPFNPRILGNIFDHFDLDFSFLDSELSSIRGILQDRLENSSFAFRSGIRLRLEFLELNFFFNIKRTEDRIPDTPSIGIDRVAFLPGFDNLKTILDLETSWTSPVIRFGRYLGEMSGNLDLFYEYQRDIHYSNPSYKKLVNTFIDSEDLIIPGRNELYRYPDLDLYSEEKTAISHNMKLTLGINWALYRDILSLSSSYEYWYYDHSFDPEGWRNRNIALHTGSIGFFIQPPQFTINFNLDVQRGEFDDVNLNQSLLGMRLRLAHGRDGISIVAEYRYSQSHFDNEDYARNQLEVPGDPDHRFLFSIFKNFLFDK